MFHDLAGKSNNMIPNIDSIKMLTKPKDSGLSLMTQLETGNQSENNCNGPFKPAVGEFDWVASPAVVIPHVHQCCCGALGV